MNIKSLLLGSAAALVAVTGARAADAVVVAEPEPVEYVKVCDAYGAGFYYIPGTETCLKVSGYVRFDVKAGTDPYTGIDYGTFKVRSRASLRFDARSETELGTLRSYAEARIQFTDGENATSLPNAFIELGGFRVGVTDSQFVSWTGYVGDIIHDDVISYGPFETNQINYTFTGGNGFSALIGVEQGTGDFVIDDYMPHIVAGAKFEQGWGSVSAVGGYDAVTEEWAGKVRLDVKATDAISLFVLGGYKSEDSYYGNWFGDWAVWGGGSFKASETATINAQAAYEDDGTIAAALNVAYELVPGFTITPEIAYTAFSGERGDDDAFGGIVRFQRNF
ncbi:MULTISPECIES: porin [Phyllobacterium]|jgi:hypothetical protein|uniref:Porin n=1 Tax=Phyllobacterium sophorae TaxID=1520277 RepID=A0A2P7ATS8_9HYPH|nr:MULTISPECIES: porin [Phyllobacterium]PSH57625.1 porin [Phyllobacterium sophorae]UXN63542.1 porin [Phyllobacterium sp. A18/5-2]